VPEAEPNAWELDFPIDYFQAFGARECAPIITRVRRRLLLGFPESLSELISGGTQ
jgi:hypothetical protein